MLCRKGEGAGFAASMHESVGAVALQFIAAASPHCTSLQSTHSQLTGKANFKTTGVPHGNMTVLSPSTIAMSMSSPAGVEIWDWRQGKELATLSSGPASVIGNARLPDNKLVAVDFGGSIRVGSLDNWDAATVIANGNPYIGVLAGQDGSFVTVDKAGDIKLWRDGTCKVTLSGAYKIFYFGNPLAIVGGRLVVVGDRCLLVSH